LRQELAQWEARIKTEAEEFERSFGQERQGLVGEIRKHEKELQATIEDYEKRVNEQEESMTRMTDDIRLQEENAEAQWRAALEQWQTDKQALQHQKIKMEQELVAMQNRFQAELRQTDETEAKIKMDIAFKEAHASSQKERLESQMQRDLDPLRD